MSQISAYLTKELLRELEHYLEVVVSLDVAPKHEGNIYESQSRGQLYEFIELLRVFEPSY
jgi:hypothetical protein